MAYADIGDKSTGDIFTEAMWDQIRANFQAGVPDIFTTKGDIAVATGADAASRLAVGADDSILVADSGESTGIAWQIQPACRAYNSGAFDPATSSWVSITLDSERFDTDAMHSTSTNTSRITIPTGGDGLYLIGGNIQLDTSGLGGEADYGLRILLNGATVIAEMQNEENNNIDVAMSISTLYSLSATDYIELQVYTEEDINVLASSNFSPEFWAVWQRRA